MGDFTRNHFFGIKRIQQRGRIKMIKINGTWIVEEDEVIYGEYGELVDKKLATNPIDSSNIA